MAFWGIIIAMLSILLAPRLGWSCQPARSLLVAAVVLLATSMWAPAALFELGHDDRHVFIWVTCATEWLGTLVLLFALLRFRSTLDAEDA